MTKHAVCIGTNYEGTPYELAGCENDARDFAALLGPEAYGVTPLIGRDATRANILSAIHDCVTSARWGDRIVVTNSSHGTYIVDRNGDEADGRDECWCPTDMQTAGLITDDDLAELFSMARTGVGILVLSDSCFSGTMTRLLGDSDTRGRVRFLSPALVRSVTEGVIRQGDLLEAATTERNAPLVRTYTERASLISGSAEDDVSYDAWFGSRPNGAFTRAAIDCHRSGMSLAAWHNAIRDRLPSEDYPQAPQLLPASLYRRYARAL